MMAAIRLSDSSWRATKIRNRASYNQIKERVPRTPGHFRDTTKRPSLRKRWYPGQSCKQGLL